MPSQLETALAEIRSARPQASEALRRRVDQIVRVGPAPRPLRRRLLVPVLVGAALVGAVVAGVALRGGGGEAFETGAVPAQEDAATAEAVPSTGAPLRAQDYRAQLTVRVDDAGRATQEAMRIAGLLGGYVVTANWADGEGDSLIVVRVPIGRAQDAIARFSQLGELIAQQYSLQDLQATIDQLDAEIERLQGRIADLERDLRNPALTRSERAVLRAQLEQARLELDSYLAQRNSTAEQSRAAEITLTLTTDQGEQGVVDDAVDALADVWRWVLAVLIVGAPFAALLLVAFLVVRRLRRRANERLLGA